MSPSRVLQTYEGEEVTVTFDPALCIHSEECVHGLPEVFDPSGRLRIRNASGETIATADAAALCRCGGTANPPYCDGSHARIAFVKP